MESGFKNPNTGLTTLDKVDMLMTKVKHVKTMTRSYLIIPGGRTMVLHLDMGDTVELFCQECSAMIEYITFCVSLTTFDVV